MFMPQRSAIKTKLVLPEPFIDAETPTVLSFIKLSPFAPVGVYRKLADTPVT